MQTAEILDHVRLALEVPPSSKVLAMLLGNVAGAPVNLRFTDADFEATLEAFRIELAALLNLEPIPSYVRALYFGLSAITVSDEPSWLHVLGSPDYSEDNRRWVASSNDHWLPGPRHFKLHELHVLLDGLSGPVQHAAGMYIGGELVKAAKGMLVANAPSDEPMPVCIGWDHAELLKLGYVSKAGWVANLPV